MKDVLSLDEALAFLAALSAERSRPDAALARLAELRARHVDLDAELIWDEEPAVGRFHYDLLLRRVGLGTVSLALTPDDGVPFPLRGLQRSKEMEVVRVDGRPLWMFEAASLLDPLWGEARIHESLVDYCILRRELETDPVTVSDEELQRAVDEYRRVRALDTAEATERWLGDHGLTLAGLEDWLTYDLAVEGVRRRRVGARAEELFRADPSRFDELHLAALPADDAGALAEEVRAGAPFLGVAERVLATRSGRRRAARSLLFETFRRLEVSADVPLDAGVVTAAQLQGAGPYLVQVREVSRAAWDEATRRSTEEHLFKEWLRDERARAHVEWNWGPSD